jgi:hypothetical protein
MIFGMVCKLGQDPMQSMKGIIGMKYLVQSQISESGL